jgi:hypothetical protein
VEEFIYTAHSDADGNIRTRRLMVHDQSQCVSDDSCVIHHPSDHHMRDWELNWRSDTKMMERLCEHGIGHPDPDGLSWSRDRGVHGCDGCCDESYECSFMARNGMAPAVTRAILQGKIYDDHLRARESIHPHPGK